MFVGTGMTRATPEEDTIRPGKDVVQETTRWMPTGVKQALRRVEPAADLSELPESIIRWLDVRGLVATPRRGKRAGELLLTDLGRRAQRSLWRRMAGQEGT